MTIKYANEFSYTLPADCGSGFYDIYKGTDGDFILFASVQITCPGAPSSLNMTSWYVYEYCGTAKLDVWKAFSNAGINIYGYIVVAHI